MALYLSKTVVELREVSLRNKPQSMLEISPKGTVPVLPLDDGSVIDESIEIIEWCIKKKKDIFKDTLNKEQELSAEDAIKLFDEKFKFHLDRYKYATRYEDVDEILHRESCVEILKTMEKKLVTRNFFIPIRSIRLIYAFSHLLGNLELPIQNGLIITMNFQKFKNG
mgnify:CR=1 FL=1